MDEKEFIERYKNMTQQERNELMLNLKEIGCDKSEITWLKNFYGKYLTISQNI